jgi:hypothetical protein
MSEKVESTAAETESLADCYDKCDQCVHSRTPYTNNSACLKCDGTDNFKPIVSGG